VVLFLEFRDVVRGIEGANDEPRHRMIFAALGEMKCYPARGNLMGGVIRTS